jgi:hypothetical protein
VINVPEIVYVSGRHIDVIEITPSGALVIFARPVSTVPLTSVPLIAKAVPVVHLAARPVTLAAVALPKPKRVHVRYVVKNTSWRGDPSSWYRFGRPCRNGTWADPNGWSSYSQHPGGWHGPSH